MKPLVAALLSLSFAALPACKNAEVPAKTASAAVSALPVVAPPPAVPSAAPAPAPLAASAPTPTPPAAAPGVQAAAPLVTPAASQKGKAVETVATRTVDGRRVETYGAYTRRAGLVSLSSVLEKPESFSGKEVAVTAKVRKACRRKGCWMEVAPTVDKTTQGCRVTFKDYGFFVPLDSAGSDAKVEAVLFVKKVSKGEVDHLESEGARFAKKEADGSAIEVRLIATGVELTR